MIPLWDNLLLAPVLTPVLAASGTYYTPLGPLPVVTAVAGTVVGGPIGGIVGGTVGTLLGLGDLLKRNERH